MNRLSSRQRKLVYFCGILILLIPIIWLGRPGAGEDRGDGSPNCGRATTWAKTNSERSIRRALR